MNNLFLLSNSDLHALSTHKVAMHLFALAWPGNHVASCKGDGGHSMGVKPFSRRRNHGTCHASLRFVDAVLIGREWFEHVGEHISLCLADVSESAVYIECLTGVSSDGVYDGVATDRWGPNVDELPDSVPDNHVWRLRRWFCYNRAIYLCREAATKEQA